MVELGTTIGRGSLFGGRSSAGSHASSASPLGMTARDGARICESCRCTVYAPGKAQAFYSRHVRGWAEPWPATVQYETLRVTSV